MVDSVKISDREELIYLLSEASELEHGLCCCYLFAASSTVTDYLLHRAGAQALTPSRSAGIHSQPRYCGERS